MKKAKRTYKDGVFRTLFNDEEKLLELYNALSGNNYPKDTKIKIITLDGTIFGDLKNDLAFLIDDRLIVLAEHQATDNPNMPLRMFCYLAREYEKLAFSRGIYSTRQILIPAPELYVFYNGEKDLPVEEELKLSDAYRGKCGKIMVEAVIRRINVNYEKGAEILKQCQWLNEYSQFIYLIRKQWHETGDLKASIEESIQYCMRQGLLTEFLKKNGGDVVSFLFEELSREECEAIREEDGFARGMEAGLKEGEKRGIQALILDNLEEKVSEERILEKLQRRFHLDETTARNCLEETLPSEKESVRR